ncbi:hypothetical protein Hanom_Chr04g00285961 [Helianthus anomalus]
MITCIGSLTHTSTWSMEESTQRRERLKAMRLEASKEDATHNKDHSAVSLTNRLLESTTNSEA